jgi:hypothetical protein
MPLHASLSPERWSAFRDLIAEMYVQPELPAPEQHAAVFRALLQLTPEAARQIPFVLNPSPTSPSQ